MRVIDDEWVVFGDEQERRVPPDELYARELLGLDIHDAAAVVAFTATHGRLGKVVVRGTTVDPFSELPLRAGLWSEAMEIPRLKFQRAHPEVLPTDVMHLKEISQHAAALKFATTWWIAHTEGRDPVEATKWWFADERNPDARGEWFDFQNIVNSGLRDFHVRVEVGDGDPDPGVGRSDPSLFGALCLQLANHIAEGASYRRCANERCDIAFVRQRGRAIHGHHRTEGNLRYCDRKCAKAQSERERRRRERMKETAT